MLKASLSFAAGHGKFETLGALGISCMLLATAGGIAWHALDLLLVWYVSYSFFDLEEYVLLEKVVVPNLFVAILSLEDWVNSKSLIDNVIHSSQL